MGAIIGSFLNVVIHRLPREGLRIWDPPYSFCPQCHHRLSWKDNIPILSYLILKGRCRYCGTRIPIRYFLVEVFNVVLYLLAAFFAYDWILLILSWGIISSLLAIAFMDLETWHIHDSLIVSLLVFSFLLSLKMGNLLWGSVSALVGFLIFFILYKFRKGMGFGDVLMVGAAGFYMNIFWLDISLLVAAVSGLLYSLFKYKGLKPKEAIPFGPFLSMGFLLSLFMILRGGESP